MNQTEDLVPAHMYIQPCVDGSSKTGAYFNFTVSLSLKGISVASPIIQSLTGIAGQIAALIYLHRPSRPSSHHRTPFYLMLTTLIWTDLIGKLITTPSPVLAYINEGWVGGGTTCLLHGYAMSLIALVTHFLVAVLALERYLGIRCGYFYNRVVTRSRTRYLLIGLWIFSLVFCSMPFLGVGEFKLHYPGTWCHLNQHPCPDLPIKDLVFGNLYATLNLTCLCMIVLSNFVVVGSLIRMRVAQARLVVSRPEGSTFPSSAERTKRPRDREIQMVIVLVVITITFICSWAPHDLLMFMNEIWPPPPYKNPYFDIQAIRLVAINQIVDPWSYIICRLIFKSRLWGCCRGVLMGKVGSIKFHSRVDGDDVSGSHAIPISKLKFASRTPKRPSLPNPAEMRMQAKIRRDQFKEKHRKPSFLSNSVTSDMTPECRVDLQRCFPPEPGEGKETHEKMTIWETFVKLLRFKHKKTDDSMNRFDGFNSDASNDDQPFIKKNSNGRLTTLNEVLTEIDNGLMVPRSRNLVSSFHGKTAKENKENNEDIISKNHFQKGKRLLHRSNSWCCSDEFSKHKEYLHKQFKKQQKYLKSSELELDTNILY